jgi:hypothetical protein
VPALRGADPPPAPDRIFMFKQSRYPSAKRPWTLPLTRLVWGALHPWLARNTSVFRADLEKWRVVCMESAFELRHVSERKFATERSLRQWSEIVGKWDPGETGVRPGRCPDPDSPALVLVRNEGKGKRSFENFSVLDQVLRDVGVCRYENVSIGSSTSLRDQARLFLNYSLLVSGHSSQLLNLIFSHPLSATLEVRPDGGERQGGPAQLWKRYPSPFCPALLCHTVFNVSANHDAAKPHFRVESFALDASALKRDLQDLLDRQRRKLSASGCPALKALACRRGGAAMPGIS